MHSSILILLPLVSLSLAGAKHRPLPDEFAAYVDWVRGKRQSHPDITVAKIPNVPFETARDAADHVPVPLEYLTPPLLDSTASPLQTTGPPGAVTQAIAASAAQTTQTSITSPSAAGHQGKWELGFDANEILVPPTFKDQTSEYDTLKLFGFTPSGPSSLSSGPEISLKQQTELLLDSFGPPPSEQDAAANRPPERFTFNNNYSPSPVLSAEDFGKPPVYSFVKTNPHGHFKWGVHIGGH